MPIGSRQDVWEGRATHTAGGLRKSDLVMDPKTGTIKSKKMVAAAQARMRGRGITGRGIAGASLSGSEGTQKSSIPVKGLMSRRAVDVARSNARGQAAAASAYPTTEQNLERRFSIQLRNDGSPEGIARAIRDQIAQSEIVKALLVREMKRGSLIPAGKKAYTMPAEDIANELVHQMGPKKAADLTTTVLDEIDYESSESEDDELKKVDVPDFAGPIPGSHEDSPDASRPVEDSSAATAAETVFPESVPTQPAEFVWPKAPEEGTPEYEDTVRKLVDRTSRGFRSRLDALDKRAAARDVRTALATRRSAIAPDESDESDEFDDSYDGSGAILPGQVVGQGFFEDVGRIFKKAAPVAGKVLKRPETAAILSAAAVAAGQPQLAGPIAAIAPELGSLLGGGILPNVDGRIKRMQVTPAAMLAAELIAANAIARSKEELKSGSKLTGAGFGRRLSRAFKTVAPIAGRLLQREEVPGLFAALGGLIGQEKAGRSIGRVAPRVGRVLEKSASASSPGDVVSTIAEEIISGKSGSGVMGRGTVEDFFRKVAKGVKRAAPQVGRALKRKEVANIARAVGAATGQQQFGELAAKVLPEIGGLLGGYAAPGAPRVGIGEAFKIASNRAVSGAGFFEDLARGLRKGAPIAGQFLKRKEVGKIIDAIGAATGQQAAASAAKELIPQIGGLLGGGTVGGNALEFLASEFERQLGGKGAALIHSGIRMDGGGAVLPGGGADYAQPAPGNQGDGRASVRGIARGAPRNGAGAVGTRGIARGAPRNGAGLAASVGVRPSMNVTRSGLSGAGNA